MLHSSLPRWFGYRDYSVLWLFITSKELRTSTSSVKSLIIVQVFTLGHASSRKRCKCSSAHSAASPTEKSPRLATSFVRAAQLTVLLLPAREGRTQPQPSCTWGPTNTRGPTTIPARELWFLHSSCSTLMGRSITTGQVHR